MKFVFACTLALTASVGAFAPNTAFARTSSLMSAVETPTFTFTKSEEIFAEAQHVRSFVVLVYCTSHNISIWIQYLASLLNSTRRDETRRDNQ
jgi:hypothetical protein